MMLRGANEPVHTPLKGFVAVPFQYGPMNKMVMQATINGHAATFMIDTGASVSVLEHRRAQGFGVSAVGANSEFGEISALNGKPYRVGYVASLKAGGMDFGGGPMALFDSDSHFSLSIVSAFGNQSIDGIIGVDILTRYKAVINCRTRSIFFKTASGSPLQLAKFALSQHFTQVPLREEVSHGFTVPASINGHPARFLVDTGAPLTSLNQSAGKFFGVSSSATGASALFSDGTPRQISLGQFNQFMIGNYKLPPQKFLVFALPGFAQRYGKVRIDGIVGMELLAFNHGIIDFGSRSLFLK
jgi:hypothetical protein